MLGAILINQTKRHHDRESKPSALVSNGSGGEASWRPLRMMSQVMYTQNIKRGTIATAPYNLE